MKYLAKIGIGNKVSQLAAIDPSDEMTANSALQHMKDLTNNENWVIAPNELCGVGCSYDDETNTFTLPKPFASWTKDTSTTPHSWEAPVAKTDESGDSWNEENQAWE